MKVIALILLLTGLSEKASAENNPCSPLEISIDVRGFQNVHPGFVEQALVTLYNPKERKIESLTANIDGDGFDFYSGAYPGNLPGDDNVGSACGTNLPKSKNWPSLGCNLFLEFSPKTMGRYNGSIVVKYQIENHTCQRKLPLSGSSSVARYYLRNFSKK